MTDQKTDSSGDNEAAPVIEGYRILEKLGRGATSSVWKAEQISLNRVVVIKVLSERLTHEPEDVTLFKAEARLAANFKHAGIVQVYDFGQSKTSRRYYFVMEYISGYSVGDWIRRKGKITEHEALVVVQAVADALKYAWDLSRIVHCDIKPDNIVVDGDGSIKVADLGLAHTVKSMSNQPGAGADEVVIMGTPNYMAPEQVRGSEPIDCRTDIYALGASLYHMVTGQLPFGDSPTDVVLERQLDESFEYPQNVNPDLSVSVTRLILKMTAKEPVARFQTWDEVLTEVVRLERQMRKQPAAATQPAAGAAAAADKTPADDSKKDEALAGEGRNCRHCGKPVQPQAIYCGFCGKPLAAPAQKPAEGRKQNANHSKPMRAKSAENGKPAEVSPANANPDMAPPMPAPHSLALRKHSTLGGIFRMIVSLCLLTFLAYYTYQKVKYDRDVIVPIKAAIIRDARPALAYIKNGLREGAQLSRRWIGVRSRTKPESSGDRSKVVPKAKPNPAAPAAPGKLSKVDSAAAPNAEPSAAEAAEPEETETVEEATPDAKVQSEKPPEVAEAPKPEPETAPVKPSPDEVYEGLLQTCKQQQPKAGDQITLHFKNERKPVEGVLEQTTSEGVRVKVPAGVIEYPFRIMAESSRLVFFPEEQARRLQRQQVEKGE